MDIILLGITVVSLIVALVMSVTAWRLTRDEKQRSAARVAALSVAADAGEMPSIAPARAVAEPFPAVPAEWNRKAPWSAPKIAPEPPAAAPAVHQSFDSIEPAFADSISLRMPTARPDGEISHASGFLGVAPVERESGGRQKSLAFAAVALFVVLSGGLMWMMSGPRGTSAVAVGPNSPLELLSLTHARQNEKLAVSGLVRNPANGAPVEQLSAVVFLFDRTGTFVTSSRAHVDFLKLGAGDETPFVVSLDAPATVARYRVSFRTDDGIVPHIDRRNTSPAAVEGEQTVNVSAK
jgi:hypothetical protein